jgi:hypothetical protein
MEISPKKRPKNGFRRSARLKSVAALTVCLIAAGAFWWLFRTETVDNVELGLAKFHFRWGSLKEVTLDSNRDGQVDGKMLIVSYDNRVGSTNFDVVEGWEATQLDGRFDLHYWHQQPSGMFIVEQDSTGDGAFDKRLEGRAAEEYLQSQGALRFLAVPGPE